MFRQLHTNTTSLTSHIKQKKMFLIPKEFDYTCKLIIILSNYLWMPGWKLNCDGTHHLGKWLLLLISIPAEPVNKECANTQNVSIWVKWTVFACRRYKMQVTLRLTLFLRLTLTLTPVTCILYMLFLIAHWHDTACPDY